MRNEALSYTEIIDWLKTESEEELESLWNKADDIRKRNVGDEVFLRALVEISNHCGRSCLYCGLRLPNYWLERYRMTEREIMDSARKAVQLGLGTIVMQSGEDYGIEAGWMAGIIARIKSETPLAVTLSLGERDDRELEMWRKAGADRYLLKFETSNVLLYNRIHPSFGNKRSDRIRILLSLREMGYETGGGIMTGIPGQTYKDVANDIMLFQELDLDMIGIGPYVPHPHTPLGEEALRYGNKSAEQVPGDETFTFKAVAISRIVCPLANIPATTAVAVLNDSGGYELGLQRGANVVMPDITPVRYRSLYDVYPGKTVGAISPELRCEMLRKRITAIGRCSGSDRGDSKRYHNRMNIS